MGEEELDGPQTRGRDERLRRRRSRSPSSSATRIRSTRGCAPRRRSPGFRRSRCGWRPAGRRRLRVASEPELFAADMPGSPIDRSFGSPTILTCDGEPHRELRALDRSEVPPARGRRATSTSWSRRSSSEHLDALEGRGEAELMAELLRAGLGAQPRRCARPRRRSTPTLCGAGSPRSPTARPTSSATRTSRRARDAACAEIDERLGAAARPARARARRLDDLAHDLRRARAGRAPPARALPADPQGDPARRHAGAGPRRRLGALRAAHPSRAARRGPRRPRRPARPGDRRGHALDLADRHPGPADDAPRSSSAASSCRPTRRSPP